eukprot:753268-Hanusia_phi.AAC.2
MELHTSDTLSLLPLCLILLSFQSYLALLYPLLSSPLLSHIFLPHQQLPPMSLPALLCSHSLHRTCVHSSFVKRMALGIAVTNVTSDEKSTCPVQCRSIGGPGHSGPGAGGGPCDSDPTVPPGPGPGMTAWSLGR